MFVLFQNNSDISCGVSDTILPFTTAIYVKDVEGLKKTVVKTVTTKTKDNFGNQVYIDQNGIKTLNPVNTNPIKYTEVESLHVDISSYPQFFDKIEVMKYKQQQMLADSKYKNCMMYEFNLNKFARVEDSINVDIGVNTIKIHPDGIYKTKAIPITGNELSVKYDADEKLEVFYAFDLDSFTKLTKSSIKHNNETQLFLAFKNKTKQNIILQAYQVLTK